jgi:type I restriction enzyme S subunit
MTVWESVTVGEVTLRVTKGTTPTVESGGFSTSGVSFVKVESITRDGRIDGTKLAFISAEAHQSQARSILQTDDLLFSIAGSIGRVARVDKWLLPANTNQALAIIRPNPALVDVGFLLYCLRDKERIDQAMALVVQSVQANLSLSELSSIQISRPTLAEQRAIANVLGALDHKIEANTVLAASADDLANTLFTQIVRELPMSSKTFADVAKVSGGGTPSTRSPQYWGGDINWATPTDITALEGPYLETTGRRISQEGLLACSSELFESGAILMTSRATIGAFAIAQTRTAVNQGFIVVEPFDVSLRSWFFHEMRSRVDEFISYANGATFLELSRGSFKKFRVRLAGRDAMTKFGLEAERLHQVGREALLENGKLASIRDTLLPQLMSGKLRVKDAEKVLEEAGV